MKTIWKYEFAVDDQVSINMPSSAQILSVGVQKPRHICIWAFVDDAAPSLEKRKFSIRGTGHPAKGISPSKYIGTVFDDQFVWHVFESDK